MAEQSDEDITAKIEKWLQRQGYPLEMEVALLLQKENFNVYISDYYQDFEGGASREIDVTALKWSDFARPVRLQVCYRVACKSSKDKPWLVFISPVKTELFPPFQLVASRICRTFLAEAFQDEGFRERFWELPIFRFPNIGHGVTQAFASGKDIPFDALMSTVKASIDRAVKFDSNYRMPSKETYKYYCVIAFPVIILAGRLFECSLNDANQIDLKETDSSVLLWKGPNPSNTATYVHIYTREAIERFAKDASDTADQLVELTNERMNLLLEISEDYHKSELNKTGITSIG